MHLGFSMNRTMIVSAPFGVHAFGAVLDANPENQKLFRCIFVWNDEEHTGVCRRRGLPSGPPPPGVSRSNFSLPWR